MKILCPINNYGEITKLNIDNVTEFYCGYIPLYWLDKYNKKLNGFKFSKLPVSINKREDIESNIVSINILKKIVNEALLFKATLYLTLNNFHYPESSYTHLSKYIKEVYSIGVSNFIVSDIGLIEFIKYNFPKSNIVLSCINQIKNKYALDHFKELGLKRITFPRQISLQEICDISNLTDEIEFECFIFGQGGKCLYDNALCLAIHCGKPFCQENWEHQYFSIDGNLFSYNEIQNLYENENVFYRWVKSYPSKHEKRNGWYSFECGLCAIPQIIDSSNITTLKLDGRSIPIEAKERQLKLVFNSLKFATDNNNFNLYKNYIKEFLPDIELCESKMRCLMPSDKNERLELNERISNDGEAGK